MVDWITAPRSFEIFLLFLKTRSVVKAESLLKITRFRNLYQNGQHAL